MSGYGDLHCASYVLLRVSDPAAARLWLGSLAAQLATGERPHKVTALNVALTFRGLKTLGLDDATLETFSRPFFEGMETPHRSRILGDAEENAPENWVWGGNDPARAVDILLLVFAENEDLLAALLAAKSAEFAQNGLVELLKLDAGRQPDSHEHFGFADGMGQPAIEGTFQTAKAAARNLLKAGEFLLGYVNDYSKLADSPMVKASLDPANHLAPPRPVAGITDPTTARTDLHDLGLNGTYLVFRQLAQNVALFRHFVDEATRSLDGNLDRAASDRLAAKFVGRWQNGAPLVLSPDNDDESLSNADDFGYRETDANGFRCPIGSHVRRSNPRDTLGPDGATALATANRHRILRRGRSYGHRPADPRIDDGVDRGLHFLCLNSDIERQFEFVQQTWVNNPVFGGLNGEVDPLIGNISRAETATTNALFTVQADPLRSRVHNLQRFVTVKGGAYFFLPSISALRYLGSLAAPGPA
jgi:Dyp-type peroxidase family